MSDNLWVRRVVATRQVGTDEFGFPLSEPVYGEPEQCLPDSLQYAMRQGYVQCEAPALVPVPRSEPLPPPKAAEVASDGWPVDAPRQNRPTPKKRRF